MSRPFRLAVAGVPELAASLEVAIDPRPSEAALKWQAEQAVWEQEQRDREALQDADRASWVQALKANPDRVRNPPGLDPGQFSSDQYNLMASIEGEGLSTSQRRGSDWRGLIPEFGEEVARAYRDAALIHWRHFRPKLASEGANRSTVPYSLIFAMAGLSIEFDENPGLFDKLPNDMVLLALRYAVYELNGFARISSFRAAIRWWRATRSIALASCSDRRPAARQARGDGATAPQGRRGSARGVSPAVPAMRTGSPGIEGHGTARSHEAGEGEWPARRLPRVSTGSSAPARPGIYPVE